MTLKRTAIACLYFICVIAIAVLPAQAATIHIPSNQPTFKAALVAADEGDTIIVAPGVYGGPGFQNIDFGRKSVWLRSFKGPSVTIIDCQGTVADPHRALYLHQNEDSTTVIEGFTFINGYGQFDGPGGKSVGGAILCDSSSSPSIINCIFVGNHAGFAGGAIACLQGSAPIIQDCNITNNWAYDDAGASITTYGGGIYCLNSSPKIVSTDITDNHAHFGGGMAFIQSDPKLDRCGIISNNADLTLDSTTEVAAGYGGGIYMFDSSPFISNSMFVGNTAVNDDCAGCKDTAMGGGLIAFGGAPEIRGCTFYGNCAERDHDELTGLGSALASVNSNASIEQSLIAYNYGREGVYCLGSDPDSLPLFLCTDIFGNQGGDWTGVIATQLGVDGNISLEPLFCDTAEGRLFLHQDSPCAAENNSCGIRMGALDVNCYTSVDNSTTDPVRYLSLGQNFPNPFNSSTTIEYTVTKRCRVIVTVMNLLGQTVRELTNSARTAGIYNVTWDGRDQDGEEVATGIYLYRIQAGDIVRTRQMVLLK